MSTKPAAPSTDASAAAAGSAASKANGPATMVIAGILALALGGLGVAAFTLSKKKQPPAMAQTDEEAAKAEAAKKAAAADAARAAVTNSGTPSKATLTVAPQEDAPLDGKNASGAGKPSAFPQEDPSLK